jgi:hypothetical protein
MDAVKIIDLVREAALSLSAILNDNANRFTKDHISKLMPTTIQFMSAMSMATTKISSQEKEISLLSQKLESFERSPASSNTLHDVCDALAEMTERSERSKNVIMFNVPELNGNGSTSTDMAEEKKQVSDILDSSNIPITQGILRVQRLGQRQDNKIRPIKVTFENGDDAKNLLFRRKKFPPSIKIKQDHTIMQRNYLRELWNEVENRRRNGEANLSVKFINGTPKIVANKMTARESNTTS